ncbi:MAG: APA family basic amino acid/polyamine antiporter [Paracoccaceae bacterium]|jgi:APA family basic amino acid/polyamine antiporter
MKPAPQLNRSLSLGLLTLYGLGTTIGAGIFVLIGKVAGAGGALGPLSFVIAAVIAGLSALSFAELSSRYPESAGEAVYVKEAFNSDTLALLTGLGVAAAGIISTATIVVGFSGYLADLVAVPREAAQVGITVFLAAVAIWGIRTSVMLAAVITLIEIGLLLVVIGYGVTPELALGAERLALSVRDAPAVAWYGVVYGGILAFYAFIGFEDIVNVAEETRDAARVVPRAIVWTLIVTTVLYISISLLAVAAATPDELAASAAPLTLIFERVSGLPGHWVSVIALLSVLNGALVQIIMVSRVLFGLSRRHWLPGVLGYVHPRTRTPVTAILIGAAIVVVLTLTLDLENLAVATSFLTLIIFAAVNAALLWMKHTRGDGPAGTFHVPAIVPVFGILTIAGIGVFALGFLQSEIP